MQADPTTTKLTRRFWSKVLRGNPDECWEWQACVSEKGYGKFEINRKAMRAHRIAWELTNGPIPDGLNVLHSCDNRRCCNPAHLSLGTQQENITDMMEKGHCGPAKLTATDAAAIRARLATGKHGIGRALAREYGVAETTISDIRHNRHWH